MFQACFCSVILSNCETWGPRIPKKVYVLYHQGIKLALKVRNCTPTSLIFVESRQPSVTAIIIKRQLKFWTNLNKDEGTELYNLIERSKGTKYVKHYINLQTQYPSPKEAYETINSKFYLEKWNEIKQAEPQRTKMKTYHEIYDNANILPKYSLSLNRNNISVQSNLTSYVMSSHNLECEKGKWIRTPKGERYCKQCNNNIEEDLKHFLFECTYFQHIRNRYPEYPQNNSLFSFFNWEHSEVVLTKLHSHRK